MLTKPLAGNLPLLPICHCPAFMKVLRSSAGNQYPHAYSSGWLTQLNAPIHFSSGWQGHSRQVAFQNMEGINSIDCIIWLNMVQVGNELDVL